MLGRQSSRTCRVLPKGLLVDQRSPDAEGKLNIWFYLANIAAANAVAACVFTEFLGAVPVGQQKQEEGEHV